MRHEYFAVYVEYGNWHKIEVNFRPKLQKNICSKISSPNMIERAKKPSRAAVPLNPWFTSVVSCFSKKRETVRGWQFCGQSNSRVQIFGPGMAQEQSSQLAKYAYVSQ
jgi:hypothetical protein